jgi:hypothetical protein
MRDVFADFDQWQKDAGYRAAIRINGFSQRVGAIASFVRIRHRKTGSWLYGAVIGDIVDDPDDDAFL